MRNVYALLVALVLLVPAGVRAEPVSVRAANHAEFGRIVFMWGAPVGYQLLVTEDGVSVRFDRPIEASYQRVLGALKGYISQAIPEADGKGVHFVLKRKFDAYSYDSGTSVIVEMAEMPNATPAQSSAKIESAAKTVTNLATKTVAQAGPPAKGLPVVNVRSGSHADYTRIVFDWASKVDYALKQSGGVVTLRFARAANLNLSRLTNDPPRLLGEIVSRVTGDATDVVLSVPPTSVVRHFLSESKVVVDIREPTGTDVAGPLPKDVLAGVAQASGAPLNTQAAPTTKPAPAPEPKPENGGKTPEVSGAKIAEVAGTEAPKSAPVSLAPPKTEQQNGAESKDSNPAGEADAPAAAPMTPVAVVDDASLEEAQITVSKNQSEAGGMDLRFDWKEPVAAAVFRRVGKLWVVFDAKRRVNIEKILGVKIDPNAKAQVSENGTPPPPPPPNLSKQVFNVVQLAATGGTVLRMTTRKGVNPVLRRDGFNWILTFREQPLEPKTPLEINAEPNSPVGARIFVPTPEPGRPIGVTDPDVGDNMVIIPLIPLSHGVAREYSYPEVLFPQTGQGVLVLANTDNLRVRPLRRGVEVTSSVPLSISSVSAEEAAGSKLGAIGPVSRLLDLERWNLPSPGDFMVGKQKLQHELVRAKGTKAKQAARWNLATFYFANAFAAEALGVLQRMVAEVPEFENTPELKLVRGASKYLLARYADAAEDLADPGLDDSDEGAFWRAAVIAKSGQMVAAAHELRRTGSVTQPYPKPLRFPLALLVAEAAVEIGDIENAQKFLDALNSANPTKNERAKIEYIEGKLAEIGGDEEGAVSKWEEALTADDRLVQVKAAYARMDILMRMQRMEPAEAIDILERLRYLWRGDEFEFNLLRRLGGLYLDENGFRNGLEALRQAATYYRDHEEAAQITQQMSDTFNFLYLKDGADKMAPVTAIALYEEFRELTPAGRKGDEMIRKLADRLVRVDLLDQAAELLDAQVRFRLKGVEKARVGTNLALVRAIAREYDTVLEVLDATQVPNIPDDIAARRRHLRAHALVGLKQDKQAGLVLKQDKSFDADLIRAEMFWQAGDWVNASQFLRRVVRGDGIRPGQPLDDEQAIRVLNLAAAYTLSGNERALIRLRSDYGAAMARSKFNEAFRLVAAPLSEGLISPSSVGQRVKTVANFRSFLDKYKEQLKTTELSSLTSVGRKLDESNVPPVKG